MLYEFDWLLKQLDSTMKYITSQQWTTLMEQFQSEFHTISLYPSLKEVLSGFETLYPDNKYRIDLEEYIRECKLDDMYRQSSGSVTVSTIHKSKGRQFSNVFIMLNHGVYTEQDKRALYVAMTRAQNNLVINTNQDVFHGISAQDLVVRTDTTEYDKPERLVFQMEHSHINLSGCKYTEHAMHQVHTDDELTVTDKGFEKAGRPVAYFSRLMTNEIEQRRAIGYQPVAATVTFKVKWYNKDEDRYYWIVLPKVMFEKQREIEQ
jgi:ATP-dependent DNA helicase RecQ